MVFKFGDEENVLRTKGTRESLVHKHNEELDTRLPARQSGECPTESGVIFYRQSPGYPLPP